MDNEELPLSVRLKSMAGPLGDLYLNPRLALTLFLWIENAEESFDTCQEMISELKAALKITQQDIERFSKGEI